MQRYFKYMIFLMLLHKCLAQGEELPNKKTKNAVEELLKKINEVSEQSFSNTTYKAKLKMFRNVESNLKKAAKSLGAKGERYVKLIMEGIKAKALSETDKNKTPVPIKVENISKFIEKNNILNDTLRTQVFNEIHEAIEEKYESINKEHLDTIQRNEKNEVIDHTAHYELNEHLRRMNDGINEEHIHRIDIHRETSTESLIQRFTPSYECEGNLDKICLNVKQMKELKCHFDDSVVPIEKLCNGLADCIDRTDEKYCTSQVSERIQNANMVMYQIDETFQLRCFPNKTRDKVMSSQIIILRSVLQAQQDFIQKYKYFNRTLFSKPQTSLEGEDTVKRAVNEISLIISSLALALDAELCSHRTNTGEEFMARKFNDVLIEDFDKVMEEVEWPPKSCTCNEDRCENITSCTDPCKRYCWQKHSLTRWSCPSINGTENVPISVICDGKFDCFDETDEKDCIIGKSFAKFEAHNIFKDILSSLSVKVTSKEYVFMRNMLLSLRSTIEDLQRFCMASEPDLKIIRALRNKCFSALSSIYSETLTKASCLYQKSEVYVFLLSLNENIVNALKRSHTGNKRIISNDGCYCKNGRCSMPVCSNNCQRSCIAEPWLTKYFCEKSSNQSVSLDDVCNGKPNCPKEDDEAECEKEICRRHHLTLLRRHIKKIGKKQEGTSMGELLTKWKTKVSSTLLVAENNERPNARTIREVVRDILNDLVTTYGAVRNYRRNNDYALEEFINIAKGIIHFLKSCR